MGSRIVAVAVAYIIFMLKAQVMQHNVPPFIGCVFKPKTVDGRIEGEHVNTIPCSR